jgi:hypothetical protein
MGMRIFCSWTLETNVEQKGSNGTPAGANRPVNDFTLGGAKKP